MTVICAVHSPDEGTWIGSDSQVTLGGASRVAGSMQKWIIGDGCALGVCGSAAILGMLHHHDDELDQSWTGHEVWKWLCEKMGEFGVVPGHSEGDPVFVNSAFLFATPEGVEFICGTGGPVKAHDGLMVAAGSGADYAQGAGYALLSAGVTDYANIVSTALEAATVFDCFCGGEPFIGLLAYEPLDKPAVVSTFKRVAFKEAEDKETEA